MQVQMGQVTRVALSLVRGQLGCPKVDSRPIMTASFQGIGGQILFANTTSLSNPETSSPANDTSNAKDDERSINQKLDQRLPMYRMRNNFARSGPGLRIARNRNSLVAEFYDLSKSVIDGNISVEEFVISNTFKDLERQLDVHIDIMSNAQIVNILASLIKMRVNPSTDLVKLLEHEVKFRINSLNLNQVMKLIKFYNSNDMSYGQKQVTDVLNNRIRACLNSNKTSVIELVEVLHHLTSQMAPSTLLNLVEEKLLNALSRDKVLDDDIVTQFIPKSIDYDYESLCNIFIELAASRRRPTPLLKVASITLAKTPRPEGFDSKTNVLSMMSTLSALINLSYHHRPLIAKLMNDITETIKMEDHEPATHCNLLRSIGGLKWRPLSLLKLYYEYVQAYHQDTKKIDHNVLLSLIHITAQLNYRPEVDVRKFYSECMTPDREKMIDKSSRKWLNHVWSLAMLGIAEEHHMASVLRDGYIRGIEIPSSPSPISHADLMKLLNLKAIARLEYKLESLESCKTLDELSNKKIQRGSDMQKYASKIREALNGIINDETELRHEIQTPYGFIVDCEILLNEDLELIPLRRSLNETIRLAEEGKLPGPMECQGQNCALIYVLFDETIANNPNEIIGHKQVIVRILKNIGYKTVFLPENLLNREKTSADLSTKIKDIIKTTISESK